MNSNGGNRGIETKGGNVSEDSRMERMKTHRAG